MKTLLKVAPNSLFRNYLKYFPKLTTYAMLINLYATFHFQAQELEHYDDLKKA